jgi:F-type H+-transporting ATPase subunit delta
MISLGGSSRQSLAALRIALDSALKGASSGDCSHLSADLFNVLGALESSAGLRRALTDPARDASAKANLVADLFNKVVKTSALDLVTKAASLRWSSPFDLADAIEQIAVEAEAAAANADNNLDQVQDELFSFSKALIENPDFRTALTNNSDDLSRKVDLIKNIYGSKYSSSAIKLINQIVTGRSGRSVEKTLSAHIHAVTARRNRVNAFIKSSIALTAAQKEKLSSSLTKKIGQSVHLNIDIDPAVIGGVSIRFGDEVIDGTIKNRLAEASRTLVS